MTDPGRKISFVLYKIDGTLEFGKTLPGLSELQNMVGGQLEWALGDSSTPFTLYVNEEGYSKYLGKNPFFPNLLGNAVLIFEDQFAEPGIICAEFSFSDIPQLYAKFTPNQ